MYFQLLRMAIHQKLVLTQRLEDIEMTDLRPANVTIIILINFILNVITITMNMIRVELDAVVEKPRQGTAAGGAAEDIPVFRFTNHHHCCCGIVIILMIIIIILVIMIHTKGQSDFHFQGGQR